MADTPDAWPDAAFYDWYNAQLRDNLGNDDDLSFLWSAFKAGRAEERARLESRITPLENALHAHDPYHDLLEGSDG